MKLFLIQVGKLVSIFVFTPFTQSAPSDALDKVADPVAAKPVQADAEQVLVDEQLELSPTATAAKANDELSFFSFVKPSC